MILTLLSASDDQFAMAIVLYIVGAIISLWILSEIIRAATKTNRKILLAEAQVKLLASIAYKLGVPLEDINKDTKGIDLNKV